MLSFCVTFCCETVYFLICSGFGLNNKAQLGQGHNDNIGDEAGEMGDSLPVTDWGSGFVVEQITCGSDVRTHSLYSSWASLILNMRFISAQQ